MTTSAAVMNVVTMVLVMGMRMMAVACCIGWGDDEDTAALGEDLSGGSDDDTGFASARGTCEGASDVSSDVSDMSDMSDVSDIHQMGVR